MTREEVQSAWENIVNSGVSNYDLLSADQKIWFTVEPLTTGGIINHYINHGAEHNHDTLKALESLGFPDIAEQMRRINRLFTHCKPPEDIEARNREWDNWSGRHDMLLNEVEDYFWTRNVHLENALMEHINRSGIGLTMTDV